MATTKTRSRDANRFGKKYSRARTPSRPFIISENFTFVEVANLFFEDANTLTYTFKTNFPDTPTVTATPLEHSTIGDTSNLGNVNVYISSLDKFTVTVKTSENFYGTVMMQAIFVRDQD